MLKGTNDERCNENGKYWFTNPHSYIDVIDNIHNGFYDYIWAEISDSNQLLARIYLVSCEKTERRVVKPTIDLTATAWACRRVNRTFPYPRLSRAVHMYRLYHY